MNRKILAIMAVGVMLIVSVAPLLSVESDASPSESKTVHPMPRSDPWVSKEAYKSTSSFSYYFENDPTDGMVPYITGQISLSEFQTTYGYISYPSGDYYYANYWGGNEFRVSQNRYVEIFDMDALVNDGGGYTQNPYDGVRDYINCQTDIVTLRTTYDYHTARAYTDYWMYNSGNSITITNDSLPGTIYSCSIPYTDSMNFYKDPYADFQSLASGSLSLNEVKSRCEYTDNVDWSKLHYMTHWENGKIWVESQGPSTRFTNPQSELNGDMYFTSDPYDVMVSYINGTIDLDTLKASCGYTSPYERVGGVSYYAASINGGNVGNASSYVRYIHVTPEYIYVDEGTYYISITDTDCQNYVYLNATNPSCRYDSISIKERKGAGEIKVKASDMISFNCDSYGSTSVDDNWREQTITYTIDPAPSDGKKMTDFTKTVTVLTDMEWVRYTTVDSYTGEFHLNYSDRYLFVQGSEEERLFLENVVDKGLMDASDYALPFVIADNQKIVAYDLRETSRWTDDYMYLYTKSLDPSKSQVIAECDAEKMTISGVDPYKFYAKYDFTIAVHYDTSKVVAVVMMYSDITGNTNYSVLESDRVYDYHMKTASEYELYCIPVTSSDGVITPTEIGLYTENVGEADNMGTVFAIVAIVLCVIAFGTLFYAGRRPRWNDSAGLPGDAEVPSDMSENKDE